MFKIPQVKQESYVYAQSGELADLKGEALGAALAAKTVTTRRAYKKKQYNEKLVDAKTGEATNLEGQALKDALAAKKVKTLIAYQEQKRNKKLVDAKTGQLTDLEGQALKDAIAAKKVKTLKAYQGQKFKEKLVDVKTGQPTDLEGEALKDAIVAKTVRIRSDYKREKLVDAKTGEATNLEGQALKDAIDAKTVKSVVAYRTQKHNEKLVDAKTGKSTDLEGEALEAALAAKTVIKRNVYDAQKRREKLTDKVAGFLMASEATPTQSPVPTEVGRRLTVAGISAKYLTGRVARLPKPESSMVVAPEVVASQFSTILDFITLQNTPHSILSPHDITEVSYYLSGTDNTVASMALYTTKPTITGQDRPIFVFAGRKEKALIPQLACRESSTIRIILVAPRGDFDELKKYIQPGIDLLIIEELVSATHGHYDNLGLPNSRRIAAFICAMLFKQEYAVPYAIMADDNLQSILFNAQSESDAIWAGCFDAMTRELHYKNAASVSVSTVANYGVRHNRDGELGSKLFMFDLGRLHSQLGTDVAHCYLPFFPSSANTLWGEDYYFQLMFEEIFVLDCLGYCVLPQDQYGITRASLPGLCRTVLKPAEALCQPDIHTLFFPHGEAQFDRLQQGINFNLKQCTERSIAALQHVVTTNVNCHEWNFKVSQEKSLMAAHAWANKLNFSTLPHIEPIDNTLFLTVFRERIRLIRNQGCLHAYQRTILDEVCQNLAAQRFTGQFNMATGTGKSYIQFYLAIAALLTGTTRSIIIVTPYRQLVQQAYDDFIAMMRNLHEAPIDAAQIIKVDSNVSSISAEVLLRNRTLDDKACILIFCEESYKQILRSTEPAVEKYQKPCVLLIDESHTQQSILSLVANKNSGSRHCFIAGLSATPKPHRSLLSSTDAFLIKYSREQAVRENHLAPCIVDRFDVPYSRENVLRIIDAMPYFLNNHSTPTSKALVHQKGIIYIPSTFNGINYSQKLRACLNDAGIACFEINADEPDSQANLQAYKSYQDHASGPKILICKGMAKIGFSDPTTSWVINLQNPIDAAGFAQSAGRAMRVLHDQKVAYVMAFADAKLELVFAQDKTADDEALARCTAQYKNCRAANQGKIAILSAVMNTEDSYEGSEEDDLYLSNPKRRRREQSSALFFYRANVVSPSCSDNGSSNDQSLACLSGRDIVSPPTFGEQ